MLSRVYFFTLALTLSSSIAFAEELPRVYVNCVLRFSKTNCIQVRERIKNDFAALITVSESAEADLELAITDIVKSSTENTYKFSWTARRPELSKNDSAYEVDVLTAYDELGLLAEISKNAARGLTKYLEIGSVKIEDGSLIVAYALPQGQSEKTWLDRLAESNWYLNVPAHFSRNKSGTGDESNVYMNGSASPEVNYLSSRFKASALANINYNYAQVATAGGSESARSFYKEFVEMALYTLTPNPEKSEHGAWNIALIRYDCVDTAANIRSYGETSAGIEWTKVPFRETQNREIAFRVGPQYTTIKNVEANKLGHLSEEFWGMFAKVFFYWAINDRLILNSNVGVERNFKYGNRSSLNASGSINYQITRFLSINGSLSRNYTKEEALYYSATPVTSGLKGQFRYGQAGGSMNFKIGFIAFFGNTSKKNYDRRWLRN